MKTLGPCDVSSFVAQSHTPCNRCVRFATTVASGHATLATKRTLLLTWARLSPAGSHQLCLAASLDDLVGATRQRKRDSDAEHLGGLEVQEQFNFRDLLDRQLARLCAFENPAGINADRSICVRTIASVANQTARCGKLAILVNRRHCVTERQRGELFGPAIKECVGGDYEAGPQLDQSCEDRIEVALGAGSQDVDLQAEGMGRRLQVCCNCLSNSVGRVDEEHPTASPGSRSY